MSELDNKILIIGESCNDVFCYGECNRLAPASPVPVFNMLGLKNSPGMAKNVQRNINALGHECDIERCDIKNMDFSKYDIIVISDYDKGFLTKEDIYNISSNHDCVFMDTKKK